MEDTRHRLRGKAMSLFSFSLALALTQLGRISFLEAVVVLTPYFLNHCPYLVTLTLIHPFLQAMQTGLIVMSGLQQFCVQFEATRLGPNDKDRIEEHY